MTAISRPRPLVEGIVPDGGGARLATQAALVFLGTAILWASAKTSVPFWPVPMNLQTLAVIVIGASYGWRLGGLTVAAYVLQGALGLPAFTGTPQQGIGLAYMMGPTGGYLVGMIFSAALVGWLAERGAARNLFVLFAAMVAADAVTFAFGFAWLAWFAVLPNGATGIGAAAAFASGVAPFLLGDAMKMALAAASLAAAGRVSRL